MEQSIKFLIKGASSVGAWETQRFISVDTDLCQLEIAKKVVSYFPKSKHSYLHTWEQISYEFKMDNDYSSIGVIEREWYDSETTKTK